MVTQLAVTKVVSPQAGRHQPHALLTFFQGAVTGWNTTCETLRGMYIVTFVVTLNVEGEGNDSEGQGNDSETVGKDSEGWVRIQRGWGRI